MSSRQRVDAALANVYFTMVGVAVFSPEQSEVMFGAIVVGLLVSVFQAVTSIQEQTLSFIPKILVIGAVLAIAGPWMLDQMLTYTQNLYTNIPNMVGP